jgi:peptide/nickel transport system substrate-binding protein
MIASLRRFLPICALVLIASVAIAACGSSKKSSKTTGSSSANPTATASLGVDLFGTLPPAGTPATGGTITQGQLTGETPEYIFPIVPGANSTPGTAELLSSIYMPLYGGPLGARPEVNYGVSAAASAPVPSNGDKTYTITIKSGMKWSNGQPVTGQDVLFGIDLLRAAVKESAANWAQLDTGEFPSDVTSATASGDTVTINLNKAYNPGYFMNNQLADTNYGVYPMPSQAWDVDSAGGAKLTDWATNPSDAKKIYDYLNKLGSEVATFGSNPLWKVNDGPFELSSFNTTNGSFVLTPYAGYGGTPKSTAAAVDVNTETSFTAELNAVKSGSLDIMLNFDPSDIPQISSLKAQGIDVFGSPSWGWFGGILNFKDTTNDFDKVIAQQYVRGALEGLINQTAIIQNVYKGAAVPAYGPTPSSPTSPYAPSSATTPTYPFNPTAAVASLKAHGWDVKPGGTTTCAKPGTAADECGAGIPAGTPITFVWANLPQSASTTGVLESEAFAQEAKQAAGINVQLQTKTFNFLTSEYNDANPAAVKNVNDFGVNNYGGLFMDYYPTQEGAWNTGGGFNTGGYSDPTADSLMNQSVFGTNTDAVKTEANFFAKALPILFFPDQDTMEGVDVKKVGGVPDGWTVMTQQQYFPQYWYTVKGTS